MEITKENLNQRKENLKRQVEQATANINACNGAIQILDSLLADLEAKPKEDKLPVDSKTDILPQASTP